MNALDCWSVVREMVIAVTSIDIIEAFDKRKGKNRPECEYATLSLKSIEPTGAAYTENNLVDGALISTIIMPSEVEFEVTFYNSNYVMNVALLMNSLAVNEKSRQLQIENSISVWRVEKNTRKPLVVGESYEDSSSVSLFVAVTLTTEEKIGYANKVVVNINDETLFIEDN